VFGADRSRPTRRDVRDVDVVTGDTDQFYWAPVPLPAAARFRRRQPLSNEASEVVRQKALKLPATYSNVR